MRVFTRLILVVSAIGLSVLSAQACEPEKAKLKIAVGSQILNYMPLPNVNCSAAGCGALSNFTRQETPDNPRMNNLLRIDGRPTHRARYAPT